MTSRRLRWLLLLSLLGSTATEGAEVFVRYDVFQDLIRETFFAAGSRHYLMGSEETQCHYAYLTEARVGSQGERLAVRMRLFARTAAKVAGRCVGPADSAAVAMSGVPRLVDDEIVLDDIDVQVGGELLSPLVSPFLRDQLPTALRLPVADLFAIEPTVAGYSLHVVELDLHDLRMEPEGVRAQLELSLEVTPRPGNEASP